VRALGDGQWILDNRSTQQLVSAIHEQRAVHPSSLAGAVREIDVAGVASCVRPSTARAKSESGRCIFGGGGA